MALRCVLSCVRWRGRQGNPADLLRLVRRCLVVFRVERFMFEETRNAIEVGLYTHWRWRFLMLRYWGGVRYNLWREPLPSRLTGDSWVPSEGELEQQRASLEEWEVRWETEMGWEVDSDATSVARESHEWESPPSSPAPSRPGEEEEGEEATEEVVGGPTPPQAAEEWGTRGVDVANEPLRQSGAALSEEGGVSGEGVEGEALSPGQVEERDRGGVASASPAVLEAVEIVVGAGSAPVLVRGEGGARAPWRRRAADDDARGGSKRRRLSLPSEGDRGELVVARGERAAPREDLAGGAGSAAPAAVVEKEAVEAPPIGAEEGAGSLSEGGVAGSGGDDDASPVDEGAGGEPAVEAAGEGGDAGSESSLESLSLGGEVSPWVVPTSGEGGLRPSVPDGPVPLSALFPHAEGAGPCSSAVPEGAEATSPRSRGSPEEMPAPRPARGQPASSASAASPAVEEGEPTSEAAAGATEGGWDSGSGGLPVWSCGWVATR